MEKHCHSEPKPPFNWNHEYMFNLYTLDFISVSHEYVILRLTENHILQQAETEYERSVDTINSPLGI